MFRKIPYIWFHIGDVKISGYLTGYLILQMIINTPFYIIFLLPISNFGGSHIWIWGTFFVFSQLIINIFLGWRWKATNIEEPNKSHWIWSYLVLFSLISVSILVLHVFSLEIRELFLWPYLGWILLGLTMSVILGTIAFFLIFLIYGLFFSPFLPPGDYLLPYGSITMGFMLLIVFIIAITFPIVSFNCGQSLFKSFKEKHSLRKTIMSSWAVIISICYFSIISAFGIILFLYTLLLK